MKYFKDNDNKVWAYEDDATPKDGLTTITEAEKDVLLAPTQEEIEANRVAEIDARLSEIDILSIRSLRAKGNGRDSQADRDRLTQLDDEAITLRAERDAIIGV